MHTKLTIAFVAVLLFCGCGQQAKISKLNRENGLLRGKLSMANKEIERLKHELEKREHFIREQITRPYMQEIEMKRKNK